VIKDIDESLFDQTGFGELHLHPFDLLDGKAVDFNVFLDVLLVGGQKGKRILKF